ncbi:MAG TPA: DUF2971 domain-containing protein [Flavisolibacter sp.]|nr:DUF2971 domain-containing protein [Flavisolibacter sp.]
MVIHETSSPKEKEAFFSSNPAKLFKYRFWDDSFHKRVLTENELFFSSPKRFNDPYDCGLPFNQHPENSDPIIIKEKVEGSAPRQFPHLINNPQALEEKCARQVLLIQQNPESWFEMNWGYKPEDLSKLFGVLSLTPHPDNYLMWSHYSNSHKGFCVEFDTRKLVESVAGHFRKVDYTDEIPFFSIKDTLEDELITKLVYTKSKTWSYEDEYRLSRIHRSDQAIKFDPEALTAVYFGCKTPYEHQIQIIDVVNKKYPWAKFYKMDLCKENFRLTGGHMKLF